MVVHPMLLPYIKEVEVRQDLRHDDHTPILLTLGIPSEWKTPQVLKVPQSFAKYPLDKDKMESKYDDLTRRHGKPWQEEPQEMDRALQEWSKTAEKMVDATMQWQHREAPTKCKQPALPERCKGRAGPIEYKPATLPKGPQGDAVGHYEPPEEIFTREVQHKVRQVRRLKTMHSTYKKHLREERRETAEAMQRQLEMDWEAIKKAKGYEGGWTEWILHQEDVHIVTREVPDIQLLESYVKVTKLDADRASREEAKRRHERHLQRLRRDFRDTSGKTIFAIMRKEGPRPLTEVPRIIKETGTLCRANKGETHIKLHNRVNFVQGLEATYGTAKVEITEQKGDVAHPSVGDPAACSRLFPVFNELSSA